MKFILIEKIINTGKILEEEYEINLDDPEYWCKNTIENFNKTLMPDESTREYIGFKIIDANNYTHQWRKKSLTTQKDKDGFFDAYICDKCGITGKKRKLDKGVINDKQYNYKKYKDCKWSEK